VTFLDEVRLDREPLAQVLKKHRGIRKIVQDLYPDRAHFIYELLQNAEDTGASEAKFELCEDSVTFEHDGRPFTKDDIWAITDIGEGTRSEDKIGRFGVGFKAVFAYSENPIVMSPTFSFQISDLVLPTEIAQPNNLGQTTKFEFPFNNAKKSRQDAHQEVEAGLEELAETTLLFLSHLKSIHWKIGERIGHVLRIEHSETHIEIQKWTSGVTVASSHFLRFSNPVDGLPKQRVSVAFVLDYLPGVTGFDLGKPLEKQFRIVVATPGRVAVFFPADKETSGLRFHLHAPFVPEVSRASIKETPANDPLFNELAVLTAAALHTIRKLKLLTIDFLAVLPNPQDRLPARYQPIRAAIVQEMNDAPLTPTHSRSHAPASQLFQARAALKDLLSGEDLAFLVESSDPLPQWAVGATQKNSDADRFLLGLAIRAWDVDKFFDMLRLKLSVGPRHITTAPWIVTGPDDEFAKWMSTKPVDWHQQMYAMLYRELSPASSLHRLKPLKLVLLSDGVYSVSSECFFLGDGTEHDKLLPRVAGGVYSSGKSKAQQEEARKFLSELGVREVGEAEQIHAILKQRYIAGNLKPQKQDLKRFVAFVEKEPGNAHIFADYFIFEGKDKLWRKPSAVFLDQPFSDTGLAAYYEAFGNEAKCGALADTYEDCGLSIKRVVKFAETVGVRTQLEISTVSCRSNPQWSDLSSVAGDRYTSHIDRDYVIIGIEDMLKTASLDLSRLIWRTMCAQTHSNWLVATYQKSVRWGHKNADSRLVHILRDATWIPQGDAFVRPADATRDLLPEGFAFDPGWRWLKVIKFGQDMAQKSEEQRQKQAVAKEFGFVDNESLERAQRFTALPQVEQERILAEFQNRPRASLPQHEPKNPERRAAQVGKEAASAPERIAEQRSRAVSIGREDVKQEAEQYLREQYTNDGEMICQACKLPLPFKLDDGTYYCEKTEFLTELKRRHYQNYLSLCPNHGAMFREANGSRESLRAALSSLDGPELKVVLARAETTLYFTKTHIADLKTIIQVDANESEVKSLQIPA
jgi:hypothetical protein